MGSPTPGLVSIAQSDIDGWASAIESAVAALQAIVANGNLSAADESSMTQAISDLQSAAGTVPSTPS